MSTAKTRKSLPVVIQEADAERGNRHRLHVVLFRKLVPITSLIGHEFLSAWWQVVLCHYTLWKQNIYHRDINPNNLMVYWSNGRWISVLVDYDLSSTQYDGPSGHERIGSAPFVAIDMLARSYKVTRLYRHDAESLVWVLVWACLRYQGGELSDDGRLLDDWLEVDAERCRQKKCALLWRFRYGDTDFDEPSPSHQSNWKIAVACLRTIFYAPRSYLQEDQSVFETWLLENVQSSL
ncbi:hypothetical protein BDR04DRAFT_1105539 [Suillus decipiens]|nr:hypothetical protein BDR04DRAFT_1105539 [Suillus decipiens]